ncbi:ion transporter [Vibrio gazogenes]|uniref:Voltage-gated potassium channel n=1 Tax=Vibrio gazogenes DSM 21264 = NBRC 103151 TaxID=1123492 RepID=A0A1M4XZV4_VIBGA|nr:ion transporter [Vibrio gazogenes]USP12824.1 ion transporter [Vibrio gazogenes]SHE99134.1 voltage-gated potassium channel [Vibrio gazogenes DSM 21264] [Vibrio gazogenes DSM 21264 = NBRC 103151]SJN56325.1 Cyclic nucleotide-gated potassium channel [Vibrio gazogenes]
MTEPSIKTNLYVIIFGTHTRAGKVFDLCLIAIIVSSLLVLILESIPEVNAQWHQQLRYFEYGFTILFTAEYLVRLYCSPHPKAYAKSFYGIVDLLAILPTYISLLFPTISFMAVIRLIRVMRIFRILKLVRYLQDSNLLMRSLFMARRKIFIFFSSVSILVTIFGVLIYVIEGPEHGFSSIPKCIYWAIVTITTVGYGDLVPQTPLGQGLASLTMLLGYSIIAVPTGIITAELSKEMNIHRQLVKCPNCSQTGHDSDALFCKHCGSQLADPDKRVVSGKSSSHG